MSVRSQDIGLDSTNLFNVLKMAISETVAPVYSLPSDDEGFGGEERQSSSRNNTEGSAQGSNAAVLGSDNNKAVARLSDDLSIGATGSTQASLNPLVLAPSYGGVLVLVFLAMIEMAQQQAQQNYEITVSSAQAMIGTDGQNGLIASWVQAGQDAAQAQGEQMRYQAIGSLVSGIISGVSTVSMIGGFIKNSTDGIGPLQTNRGKLNEQLTDANNYRSMLDRTEGKADVIVRQLDTGKSPTKVIDSVTTARKQQLIDGFDIETYKGPQIDKAGITVSLKDRQTEAAAKHLDDGERVTERKAADKRKKSLQSQIDRGDTAQQSFVQALNMITQSGSSIGQSYGGMAGAEQTILAGEQKTTADVMQQAGQTTESVKEKASSKAQSYLEDMVRLAEALAQALSSQVKA